MSRSCRIARLAWLQKTARQLADDPLQIRSLLVSTRMRCGER
jgi:hypothetical protein